MTIEQNVWGVTPEGEAIIIYTLKNALGSEVQLTNIGAAIVDKLSVVLIGGHHKYLVTSRCTLLCQCADDIVGLEILDLENGYAHRLQETLHIGYRELDILGCGRTVGLVLLEESATETTTRRVEGYTQKVGLLAAQNVAQELREAEDNRGVETIAVAHRATHKGVVVFENQCISIDEKKAFHLIEN